MAVPPVPEVTLFTDPSAAAIRVAIGNPTPGGGQDTTASNDIYRRISAADATGIRVATGVPANSGWTDWTPVSGVDYAYRAVAIGATGSAQTGAWVSTPSPLGSGIYPSLTNYPSLTTFPGA